jgi:hypothetical protein
MNSKKETNLIAKLTKYQQEERFEHKHKTSLLIGLQEGWLHHN